MKGTATTVALGLVTVLVLASAIRMLPVSVSANSSPSCYISVSPYNVRPDESVGIKVKVYNAPGPQTYHLDVTVTTPGGTHYTDSTTISTDSSGSGSKTVHYPSDFPGGSTTTTGTYTVYAKISGYSVTASCSGYFKVTHDGECPADEGSDAKTAQHEELCEEKGSNGEQGNDARELENEQAEKNQQYTDRSGEDHRKADYRGYDFTKANFRGADLAGSDLTGANLSFADLTCVSLAGANLSGAIVVGAILDGVDLTDANLQGVDLSGIITSIGFTVCA